MNAPQIRAKSDGRGTVMPLASATSTPLSSGSQQDHFPVSQQYAVALPGHSGGEPLQLLPWELLRPLLLCCDEAAFCMLDCDDPPPPPQLTGHSASSSQHFHDPLGQQTSVLLHSGRSVSEHAPPPVLPEEPLVLAFEEFPPLLPECTEEFCPEEALLPREDEGGALEEADTTHGARRTQLMPWLMR